MEVLLELLEVLEINWKWLELIAKLELVVYKNFKLLSHRKALKVVHTELYTNFCKSNLIF